ncbi:MAG: MazG family protein [Chloroflexi bacterium]|nr:MazG family protein [Chloroflexota bacterium]
MFTLSELAPILAALDDQAYEALQIVAAAEAAGQYYPHFDPGQPALLIGPGDGAALSRIGESLGRAYPPGHPLTVIAGAERETLPLSALAGRGRLDPGTALWIPPLPAAASYADLQDVIAHLRAPEGCPWDRELTWARLRASLLEESYELLTALDADDAGKVAEELGDLLLQVGMQTQIAAEEGRFRLPDVIAGIVGKLIRRHPHVFGDVVVSGTGEVLANWEAIKRTEREGNGGKRSPLSGVPAGLPALAQADAYLDRMSRLRAAAAPIAPWAILAEAEAKEGQVTPGLVGAALFGLVAWIRARGVDAESALRAANARFADQVAAEEEG